MFLRKISALLLLAAQVAAAQAPMTIAVPLAPVPGAISPGANMADLAAARSAQELGLDSIAVKMYRDLLAIPGTDRASLTLALASALLDDGRPLEAEQALHEFVGPRGAAWHLRAALAAAQQKKTAATRAEFDAIRPEELPKTEHGWFLFLQGMLTMLEDPAGGVGKANVFYQQALDLAEKDALPEITRARFELALQVSRLRLGVVQEAYLETARLNVERTRGRGTVGYDFARNYAVMLDRADRKGRAVEVLQEQLRSVPAQERAWVDDFRLLLGFIGGAESGAGRNALVQLLEKGSDARRQRIALQLLARASESGAARAQFRAELDQLIKAGMPAAILEDLYLIRASVALAEKNYAQAEDDANTLRQKYPGSPLLPHAYNVLASSAWEQRRYRLAADHAAKARDALPPGAARAQLGVLVAEAWFLAGQDSRGDGVGDPGARGAGEFRLAADAYAAVLSDPPPGMPPADLMYQRVLAEIETGSLDAAAQLLGQMTGALSDPINRWKGEWNLSRALLVAGRSREALSRVSGLLAEPGAEVAALPLELRVRMAWLQTRLSFDVEPSEQTLKLIDELIRSVDGMEAGLKTEIASTSALLKAQTYFALKRDAEGLATLAQLRKDFPKERATVKSYMTEATHYAEQDNAVKAQNLLTTLAEEFPESEDAPWALLQAAAQAERRGQAESYREAVRRIEDAVELMKKYPPKDPANDLIFTARLKQGDLYRMLNDFALAQQVYQDLRNNYRQHKNIVLAELALAQCHNAQSSSDPSHADNALDLFGHLLVRLDVPVDVRVEAGCNLGELWVRRGKPEKAVEVWWRDVVHPFLITERRAAELGATGRFWMGRAMIKLADLLVKQEKFEEAKKVWALIVEAKLPGEETARQELARLNVTMESTPLR